MKQQPNSKKTLIIGIVAIIILALAYFYFSGDPVADSGSSTLESQSATIVGARVLSLLNQIQSLHIDTSIFEDQAYKSLVDYTVGIPELPVGRANPFAPLPGVSVSTTP